MWLDRQALIGFGLSDRHGIAASPLLRAPWLLRLPSGVRRRGWAGRPGTASPSPSPSPTRYVLPPKGEAGNPWFAASELALRKPNGCA